MEKPPLVYTHVHTPTAPRWSHHSGPCAAGAGPGGPGQWAYSGRRPRKAGSGPMQPGKGARHVKGEEGEAGATGVKKER